MVKSNNKYFEAEDEEVLSAQILGFAREYHAVDFPNPKRIGCPSNEILLKIADEDGLPMADLREHLLSCSPCFLEFQAARQIKTTEIIKNPTKIAAKKASWYGFFLQPFPAAALLILITGITAVILYNLVNRRNTEIVSQNNNNIEQAEQTLNNQKELPDAVNTQTGNNDKVLPQSSPEQNDLVNAKAEKNPKKVPATEPKLLAKNIIKLDLAQTAISRDGTSRERIISLPSKNLTLSIKLPANSPAGDYEISLLDETGNTLLDSRTKFGNGRFLTADLDLRKKSGRARLCIAPKGEVPDCFAVSIGRAK